MQYVQSSHCKGGVLCCECSAPLRNREVGMSISLLLPTRKRPKELRRMVESVRKTADSEVEVVVYIDTDDELSVPVAQELGLRYKVGPRIRKITQAWNEILLLATGDIFQQTNDDIVFTTKGWDAIIEK